MFRIIGIVACALFFVLVDTTMAQADAILRIDDNTSDSDCIGDGSTPVCAVETWFACFARRAPSLCKQIVPHIEMLFFPQAKPYFIEYQIADVLPITLERITPELSVFEIKPGYMEVRVRRRGCRYAGRNCGGVSPAKSSYFLKFKESGWIIVAWTHEMAPETCEPFENSGKWMRDCLIFIYKDNQPWVHDNRVDRNWQ